MSTQRSKKKISIKFNFPSIEEVSLRDVNKSSLNLYSVRNTGLKSNRAFVTATEKDFESTTPTKRDMGVGPVVIKKIEDRSILGFSIKSSQMPKNIKTKLLPQYDSSRNVSPDEL